MSAARFGGLVAPSEVSLSIHQGEIYGLIGPNGAGKTTLFNVLTGLYGHDEGRFRFEGRPLGATTPDRIAALGIARTFQNIRLFPEMTALENKAEALQSKMTELTKIRELKRSGVHHVRVSPDQTLEQAQEKLNLGGNR